VIQHVNSEAKQGAVFVTDNNKDFARAGVLALRETAKVRTRIMSVDEKIDILTKRDTLRRRVGLAKERLEDSGAATSAVKRPETLAKIEAFILANLTLSDARLVEVKGLHTLTLRTVDTELPTTPEVFEKGLNADYLSRGSAH
jgi:hypothetical protein